MDVGIQGLIVVGIVITALAVLGCVTLVIVAAIVYNKDKLADKGFTILGELVQGLINTKDKLKR